MHRIRVFSLAAGGLCALGAASMADVIPIFGDTGGSTEGLGDYSGTISYTGLTQTTGSLVITLTNESSSAGGKITGLVFNIGSSDPLASATLSSTDHASFLDTGSEDGSPFGQFEAGAALGADWSGGGSPNPGIHIGDTGTFTFDVTAADASLLSAIDFLDGTAADVDFVVRLRGFDAHASLSALRRASDGPDGALAHWSETITLDPTFALAYLVYVLIVVAVGGLGSIGGSFAAAVVLGISDMAGKYYFPWLGAFLIYLVMVGLLMWRPAGLFGKR